MIGSEEATKLRKVAVLTFVVCRVASWSFNVVFWPMAVLLVRRSVGLFSRQRVTKMRFGLRKRGRGGGRGGVRQCVKDPQPPPPNQAGVEHAVG